MPAPNHPRQSVSFRIRADLVARMRSHIRDHSGRPQYLALASFLESAIEREIERTGLIAAGALPLDQSGDASDPIAERRTVLGNHHHHASHPVGPSGCQNR